MCGVIKTTVYLQYAFKYIVKKIKKKTFYNKNRGVGDVNKEEIYFRGSGCFE